MRAGEEQARAVPRGSADELDRRIDRVLSGLGGGEPSAAFVARLAAEMQARQAERASARRGSLGRFGLGWMGASRGLSLRVAVAGCAVGLGLAGVLATRQLTVPAVPPVPARMTAAAAPRVAGQSVPGRGLQGQMPPGRVESLPAAGERVWRAPTATARRAGLGPERAPALALFHEAAGLPAREIAAVRPQGNVLDEPAAVDLQTPSFPAPPLPPTAQERRVRLMLRRGEERDLAALDPARAELSSGQDKAALRSFFDPPRMEVDPFGGVLPW